MRGTKLAVLIALTVAPAWAAAQSPYLVKNINPAGDSFAFNLVGFNGKLYFSAADDEHGTELWTSNGSEAGTHMVLEMGPGMSGGFPQGMTEYGGKLYFSAYDAEHGTELWSTDGTESGTALVADTNPGPANGNPEVFVPYGGTLYFRANNEYGIELWKSDGTTANTNMVADIHVGDWSIPTFITGLGDRVYFGADDKWTDGYGYDRELWTSDGTEGGTYRVKDINVGPGPSIPASITRLGDALYFQARNAESGIELWRSDGTESGTTLLKDIAPDMASGVPQNLTLIGSSIYFLADNGVDGLELWKTDGTTGGTSQIKDINPDGSSTPLNFTAFNGGVAFTADDGVHGSELWWTDGTESGTKMVADLVEGAGLSAPLELTVAGEELYFVAISPGDDALGTNLTALWKTDGTEDGTSMVWQAPGEFWGYTISELTLVGDTLYFLAPTGVDEFGYSADIELYAIRVPEPASLVILLAGAPLLLRRR